MSKQASAKRIEEAWRRIKEAALKGSGILRLSDLGLGDADLAVLAPEIGNLRNLQVLYLDSNQLATLPKEIEHLKNLQVLSLDNNQLATLPKEIEHLKNLQGLYLDNNRLATLPKEIEHLKNLQVLSLSNNQLATLPKEIEHLKNLQWLSLDSNQLATLPKEIEQLKNLQRLFLSNNRLATLPKEIEHLKNLQVLSLSNNQLATLPKEIEHLKNLERLHLNDNRLAALPKEIEHLKNLERLHLNDNQLAALPKEIEHLKNLQVLHLSNNQLAALPKEIGNLSELKELFLHGNHELGLSDEVLGPTWGECKSVGQLDPARPGEILDHYFRLQRAKGEPLAVRSLNEAKVLVVGEPGVGKSVLIDCLLRGKPKKNTPWTKGIKINTWRVKPGAACPPGQGDIKVNVWDFGGQEIMQATHQFFLTERSLYLLVLDSRENEEQSKVRYWLDKVRAFGGDSPVIVVLNKRDQGTSELDEARLKQDYPKNLLDPFQRTACFKGGGCKEGHGIEELKRVIEERVRTLDNVTQPVPVEFLDAKAAFEKESKACARMSRADYAKVCAKAGLKEEIGQATLLSYLRSLGSLFYHERDGESGKSGTTKKGGGKNLVLEPTWLTGGVYRILTDPALRSESNGILRPEDVKRVFGRSKTYPEDARDFILSMMEGDPFELSFRMDGTDDRLIPELLPPSEFAHGIDPANSLNFLYKYRFLPAGLIPRFIVRMHRVLEPGAYWRNGVVLKIEGRRVLVRGVREQRRVFVSVEGREMPDSPRRGEARRALAVVRENMRMVHGAMKHLEVEERVPLPDDPGETVRYSWLVDREHDEGPALAFTPEGGKRKYTVRELLEGVREPLVDRYASVDDWARDAAFRKSEGVGPLMKEPGEVFISYAHENAEHAQEVKLLADRLREWGVDAWVDQYVELPGPKGGWRPWMRQKIKGARAVLMVAGPKYLKRVNREDKDPASGHGATWEGELINQELYETKLDTDKYVPVVMRKEHEEFVPDMVRGRAQFRLYDEAGFERLYRALTGQPRIIAPPLGQPRKF